MFEQINCLHEIIIPNRKKEKFGWTLIILAACERHIRNSRRSVTLNVGILLRLL